MMLYYKQVSAIPVLRGRNQVPCKPNCIEYSVGLVYQRRAVGLIWGGIMSHLQARTGVAGTAVQASDNLADTLTTAALPEPPQLLIARPPARVPTSIPRRAQSGRARESVTWDSISAGPLRQAMRGVRFRIVLGRQEVRQGVLALNSVLAGFVSQYEVGSVQWMDEQGQPLSAPPAWLNERRRSLGKAFTYRRPALDLGGWIRARRARPDDSILVTVEDWDKKRFRLELEPRQARRDHLAEIERHNQKLTNILVSMLQTSRSDSLHVPEAIPTAYASLADPLAYPGDPWTELVDRDPRIERAGASITYVGRDSPLEHLLENLHGDPLGAQSQPQPHRQIAGRQVYRFRVRLKDQPESCRFIEILPEQTLGHLDFALRDAFEYHPIAHATSYQLLSAGANGQAENERGLGYIDPYAEDGLVERKISELRLVPRSRLAFVYDLRRWIEHELELEAIQPADPMAIYPKVMHRERSASVRPEPTEDEPSQQMACRTVVEPWGERSLFPQGRSFEREPEISRC
jgi:hypothetical protein